MSYAYYFTHDFYARQDPKMQHLLATHGVAGVGLYWCIVEQLFEQDGALPMSSVKIIAWQLHCDIQLVESVINDFELFVTDGDFFWSESAKARLKAIKDKSETNRKNVQKRYENKQPNNGGTTTELRPNNGGTTTELRPNNGGTTTELRPNNGGTTTEEQNKRKEIKEEDSKESDKGGTGEKVVPPGGVTAPKKTLKERMEMFYTSLIPYMSKYSREMLRDFFNYWSEPDRAKNQKMRWEKEKTWETSRRLATWAKRDREYSSSRHDSGKTTMFDEIARLNAKFLQPQQLEQ